MVKIFVGNCSDEATGDDLRAYFGKFGRVVEADVINGKGYGFVHMDSSDDADSAVAALDGTDFKGKRLRVEIGRRGRGGGGSMRGGGGGRDFGGDDRRSSHGRSGGDRSSYGRGNGDPYPSRYRDSSPPRQTQRHRDNDGDHRRSPPSSRFEAADRRSAYDDGGGRRGDALGGYNARMGSPPDRTRSPVRRHGGADAAARSFLDRSPLPGGPPVRPT